MHKVIWKRLSDGAVIRVETDATAEEAIAEAQEALLVGPEAVKIVVIDEKGAVVFGTEEPPP